MRTRPPTPLALPLLSAALLAMAFVGTRGQPAMPGGPYCYLQGDADHTLTWVALDDLDPRTNETTLGRGQLAKNDAMALQPRTGRLFGVDALMPRLTGHLGLFDTTTGAFQPMDASLGTGYGVLGAVRFYDVSGLAFDPVTGWLYAVQIETGEAAPDLLFRVDPATGQVVPGAFGGADYVPLYLLPRFPLLGDIDDIAFEPGTGRLYGILNNSGDGDRLVQIDKFTGALTDVGAFGVGEVEGLDFDPAGRLWATAGGDRELPNQLYRVNVLTGQASDGRVLDNSANYEALACLTAAPDLALSLSERGGPQAPGELLVFTLRYANLGNAPAHGVTLTHTLPLDTYFYPAVSSLGWLPTTDPRVLTIDLGTVPPEHRGLVNLAAVVGPGVLDAPGVFASAAALAGDGTTGIDLNPHDNAARLP